MRRLPKPGNTQRSQTVSKRYEPSGKLGGLTQQQMSAQLDISQAEVSLMERRNNLHLATLARFIRATGGRLRITAVFDDQETEISIGDILPVDPDPVALT